MSIKITEDATLYKQYLPFEKLFIILPFCHAEDKKMTAHAVTLS